MESKRLSEYEVPRVVTFTDEELLEELGEAQACYIPINVTGTLD